MKKMKLVIFLGMLVFIVSGVASAEEWKRIDFPEWVQMSLEVPENFTRTEDQKTPTMLVHYFQKKENYSQKVIVIEKHPIVDSFPKEDIEKNPYLLEDYPMDNPESRAKVLAYMQFASDGAIVNLNDGHQGVAYSLEGRDIVGVHLVVLKKGYIIRVVVASDRQLIPEGEKEFVRILESLKI